MKLSIEDDSESRKSRSMTHDLDVGVPDHTYVDGDDLPWYPWHHHGEIGSWAHGYAHCDSNGQ